MALSPEDIKRIRDFMKNTQDAERMRGTNPNTQSYIFNKPGNYYQQDIPPVKVPQAPREYPEPEWGPNVPNSIRSLLRQYLWKQMMQRIYQQRPNLQGTQSVI